MKARLVTVSVFAVINVVLWGFFLPRLNDRREAELSAYNKLREQLSGGRIASFQDMYSAREKLGEYEKKFRERKDFAKLITYLFDQAMASQVDINNISYSFDEKKDMKLVRLTMTVAAAGKYGGMRKFMHSLESGSHFMQIEGMKLSRQVEDSVTAGLVLTTYLKTGVER